VISPWHVIDRYRYSTIWLLLTAYLVLEYRIMRGHW
jgi:hypothetical protein